MTMVTEVAASRRDTNSEQETTQTTRGDREQNAESRDTREVTHPVASLGSLRCGTWKDSAVVSVDGRDAVGSEAVACGFRLGGVQLVQVPCVVPQGSRAAGRQGGSARPGSHQRSPSWACLPGSWELWELWDFW